MLCTVWVVLHASGTPNQDQSANDGPWCLSFARAEEIGVSVAELRDEYAAAVTAFPDRKADLAEAWRELQYSLRDRLRNEGLTALEDHTIFTVFLFEPDGRIARVFYRGLAADEEPLFCSAVTRLADDYRFPLHSEARFSQCGTTHFKEKVTDPPAKPGAFECEPPRAATDGRLPAAFAPPKGGAPYSNRSFSCLLSSISCSLMYLRIASSSRPTVDTKYPRAQKWCPTKLRPRSKWTRAMWIALFPLMYPTTCATECFGGIDINMCTWSGRRCPSSTSHSFCLASVLNTFASSLRTPPYSAFRLYFGMNTTWYLHSHTL